MKMLKVPAPRGETILLSDGERRLVYCSVFINACLRDTRRMSDALGVSESGA